MDDKVWARWALSSELSGVLHMGTEDRVGMWAEVMHDGGEQGLGRKSGRKILFLL